jgi:hypothetical protein
MTEEMAPLDEAVIKYGKAKRHTEAVAARQKEKVLPYERIIRGIKSKFAARLKKAREVEAESRSNAISVALGSAGGRGRVVVESSGEWVQVEPPKRTAAVTDIGAFLKDPLSSRIISSITLNQAATLALLETGEIAGVEIEEKPVVKFHILKEAQ